MQDKVESYKALLEKEPATFSAPPLYNVEKSKSGEELLVPGDLARGPWFEGVQHGGAIVALLARAVERIDNRVTDGSTKMRITALNVEMFRKVPLEPVMVKAKMVRDGKRIGAIEASMYNQAGDLVLARAQALRIRETKDAISADKVPPVYEQDLAPSYTGELELMNFEDDIFFYVKAFESWHSDREMRGATGSSWWRLLHPMVEDEMPSPLVRLGATADLLMSANALLGRDFQHISVNPNLFISIQKEMVGEWVGLESIVRIDGLGIGETTGTLYDKNGRVGSGIKSLLNEHR